MDTNNKHFILRELAWVERASLSVCLSFYLSTPQHNSKMNDPKVFKLATGNEWPWDILEVISFFYKFKHFVFAARKRRNWPKMLSLRGRCLDVMTCMFVCRCSILITGWLGSYVPGTASSMSWHNSSFGETYCSSSDVNYRYTLTGDAVWCLVTFCFQAPRIN